MKEIRHLKTIENKRNLNTKWLLLQNDQNADTTLLHSHDEILNVKVREINNLGNNFLFIFFIFVKVQLPIWRLIIYA